MADVLAIDRVTEHPAEGRAGVAEVVDRLEQRCDVERYPAGLLEIGGPGQQQDGEDIIGATVGLVLSLPVIAVAAVLIKRSSPGPVFYRQERCGEGGGTFTLLKLRTMPVDAEAQTGPVWTVENDARRTRVGECLRSCNLDELPQFWNVLKGEMTLVGPRPERPHFVEQFKETIGNYMSRHAYKPGMTGWAQVNGLRGNTDLKERVKYDLYYLENWSLAFDFKILLKTAFARKNAY